MNNSYIFKQELKNKVFSEIDLDYLKKLDNQEKYYYINNCTKIANDLIDINNYSDHTVWSYTNGFIGIVFGVVSFYIFKWYLVDNSYY